MTKLTGRVAAKFKSVYLICGDDHGRIAERRAGLNAVATQQQSDGATLETVREDQSSPELVANLLSTMTFSTGRRFIIVDGVEKWKDAQLEPLQQVLTQIQPETTVAFFARESGRAKAPKKLHAAVKAADGSISVEASVKPWELPKWVMGQAAGLGLKLDLQTAKVLIERVGERPQRLLRELEKLELAFGSGAQVDVDQIDALSAGEVERKAWSLADLLLSKDQSAAVSRYLELLAQGENPVGLVHPVLWRVRAALDALIKIQRGEPASKVKGSLRMPPKAAERFLRDIERFTPEELKLAIERLAEVELASRGAGSSSEQTAGLRTVLSF